MHGRVADVRVVVRAAGRSRVDDRVVVVAVAEAAEDGEVRAAREGRVPRRADAGGGEDCGGCECHEQRSELQRPLLRGQTSRSRRSDSSRSIGGGSPRDCRRASAIRSATITPTSTATSRPASAMPGTTQPSPPTATQASAPAEPLPRNRARHAQAEEHVPEQVDRRPGDYGRRPRAPAERPSDVR